MASLPPRWFITSVWSGHRALYRSSGGRVGLRAPRRDVAGMLRLRSLGRTTGIERTAIVCYVEDGPRLVTLAMNGWGDPAPQWWRNLQAAPDTSVDTVEGQRDVRARAAEGDERAQLWDRIRRTRGWGDDLDALAAMRSRETAVVVLDPRVA